ncbi:hypothetical protein DES53_10640 [Roseimicrobium gellanilyticum]|uniref:Uncharacterized protein n=1 Tax=Roseimicrobium gellanilyticum TaxID=748857 RepID=A0A366HHV3_9BACT|nr:hypothetical protein [Roseimicrobium gellanilyticum]RBP42336.1 hypothetical protein DES53_10640 [Roseimicrobium gellanilyticum]
MKATKRFIVWVGAFALLAFSSIESAGHIILSRGVRSDDSLVPLEFSQATDSRKQWEIITAAMEAGPDGGYTLTNVDVERAKELVYVALTCAPEEWEGGGSVFVYSTTVRFLGEVYPGVPKRNETMHNQILLRQLREILYQHPPQGWRIVWASLFGEWRNSGEGE